jgi:hypothetical protein
LSQWNRLRAILEALKATFALSRPENSVSLSKDHCQRPLIDVTDEETLNDVPFWCTIEETPILGAPISNRPRKEALKHPFCSNRILKKRFCSISIGPESESPITQGRQWSDSGLWMSISEAIEGKQVIGENYFSQGPDRESRAFTIIYI